MNNLLNIGKNSLLAHSKALEVISNNLANANKAGYAKQIVEFQDTYGLGGVGKVHVSRIVNNSHIENMHDKISLLEKNKKYNQNISRLESNITNHSLNINTKINDLFNSIESVTFSSDKAHSKEQVFEKIKNIDSYFKLINSDLNNEKSLNEKEFMVSLEEVNGLIDNINTVNEQITEHSFDKEKTYALKDEKDRLLNKLSEYVDIEQVDLNNGKSAVYLKNGEPLILDNKKLNFQLDSNNLDLKLSSGLNHSIPVNANSIGGKIEAFYNYNEDINSTKNNLNDLYTNFTNSFNTVNSNGVDSNNNNGQNIFNLGNNQDIIGSTNINILNAEQIAFSKNNSNNNENLIDFINIKNQKDVNNKNLEEQFLNMSSLLGVKTNNSENNLFQSQALHEESLEQVKDSSRVNVEEEIVNMERYQQAYEASSRVIKVAQEMFDVLMQSTKR